MTENRYNVRGRITSIDALRAVTLFGIFLVHASALFSFINSNNEFSFISNTGETIADIILSILQFRCNTVFGILFGVSFYLILKNPNYTSKRFVWRCFILIFIGLLNKVFYTNDALMWYGIWGIILVLFRKCSTKGLFISFCIFCLLSCLASRLNIRYCVFGDRNWALRYDINSSLLDIINYPIKEAVTDYIYLLANKPFDSLWKFILGYYLAKAGYIENIEKYSKNRKLVLWSAICYFAACIASFKLRFIITNVYCSTIFYLLGALTYSIFFLFLYYKFYPKLCFLEDYGKLGLTNYSMQGIIGISLTTLFIIPFKIDLHYAIFFTVIIFLIQLIFSHLWLKYFKNGPMEYIWRSLTNLKFTNPLNNYGRL